MNDKESASQQLCFGPLDFSLHFCSSFNRGTVSDWM